MNYIVLDLEWNQCPYGKERENKGLPFEIIEIGAVKLNSNREITDEFQQIIKPTVYDQLHYRTKEIIGIDKGMLAQGVPFPVGVDAFLEWCGKEPAFCTWGPMDLVELQRNMRFYGLMDRLKGPIYYYDVQKLFAIEYENRKSRRALEYAIDFLNIEKTRGFHRALADAYYTAEVMKKIHQECIQKNYSIDSYQNPKTKKEEIYAIYEDYSKYISREFPTKEDAMKDREVVTSRCFLCKKNAKKKVRWYSMNTKIHFCLAYCPEHGYLKGKIRMKKTDDGKVYVVKTVKRVEEEEALLVREKKEMLRRKRQVKRQKS